MRQVADGSIAPAEAVKAYHGELQKQRHQAVRGRSTTISPSHRAPSAGQG